MTVDTCLGWLCLGTSRLVPFVSEDRQSVALSSHRKALMQHQQLCLVLQCCYLHLSLCQCLLAVQSLWRGL